MVKVGRFVYLSKLLRTATPRAVRQMTHRHSMHVGGPQLARNHFFAHFFAHFFCLASQTRPVHVAQTLILTGGRILPADGQRLVSIPFAAASADPQWLLRTVHLIQLNTSTCFAYYTVLMGRFQVTTAMCLRIRLCTACTSMRRYVFQSN